MWSSWYFDHRKVKEKVKTTPYSPFFLSFFSKFLSFLTSITENMDIPSSSPSSPSSSSSAEASEEQPSSAPTTDSSSLSPPNSSSPSSCVNTTLLGLSDVFSSSCSTSFVQNSSSLTSSFDSLRSSTDARVLTEDELWYAQRRKTLEDAFSGEHEEGFRVFGHPSPPSESGWLLGGVRLLVVGVSLFLLRLCLILATVMYVAAAGWLILGVQRLSDLLTRHPRRSPSHLCRPLRKLAIFTIGIASRIALLAMGFWRIRVSGTRDERVSTVVSNHVSYLDILVYCSLYGGSFIAKEGVKRLSVVGLMAQINRSIFVDHLRDRSILRTTSLSGGITSAATHPQQQQQSRPITPSSSSSSSFVIPSNSPTTTASLVGSPSPIPPYLGPRESAALKIVERQQRAEKQADLPPLIIFPEGTTTNGLYLARFKTGAFIAGLPVQPIVLRYRFRHFSPSWESIPFGTHFFRMLSQIYNQVEVIQLPPYFPSPEEQLDPVLYANNVQHKMAEALNVPVTPYSTEHKVQFHTAILDRKTSWKYWENNKTISGPSPYPSSSPNDNKHDRSHSRSTNNNYEDSADKPRLSSPRWKSKHE